MNSISLNDDIGTARCYDIASWDAIFLDILESKNMKRFVQTLILIA